MATTAPSVWNLPNALTVLRLVLVPVFIWLLMAQEGGSTSLRLWAAVLFAVAIATDWLDGELARRQGLVTDFGKIADPIADKALMGGALIGLSLLGELAWWITALILVREVGITVLRFVVIRYGVIAASPGGKLKTALQALALLLLIMPPLGVLHSVGLVVMYAALVVTVVTGADYLVRAWRLARGART